MKSIEANPFKSLGIDSATIKAIMAAGGVDALKAFAGGYRRAFSPALHPDKTSRKVARDRFVQLNASCEAIISSPEVLVEQWVKGLATKKSVETTTVVATSRGERALDSLIRSADSARAFWLPARYIVDRKPASPTLPPSHAPSSKYGLAYNTPQGLYYRRVAEVSGGQFLKKSTINEDIELARRHEKLTAAILDNVHEGINGFANGIVEIGEDGYNVLYDRQYTILAEDVLSHGSDDSFFANPGIYNISVFPEARVREKTTRFNNVNRYGPALTSYFPSIQYLEEPYPIRGKVIGFVDKEYRTALATKRGYDPTDSGRQPMGELAPGEAKAIEGSMAIYDDELALIAEFYRAACEVSSSELLISRAGMALTIGRIAMALPPGRGFPSN